MKKSIILLIVLLVIIVIVIIIVGFLMFYFSKAQGLTPVPAAELPFRDGDKINLGFLLKNNQVPIPRYLYSYYWLAALNNNNSDSRIFYGSCLASYKALDAVINNNMNESVFTVNINPSDNTKFTLRASDGTYCFLAKPLNSNSVLPDNNFISFGQKDNSTPEVWFSLSFPNRFYPINYVLTAYNGDQMGIIKVSNQVSQNYLACYNGMPVIDTNVSNYIFGYIVGKSDSNVLFNILNLTSPIRPPIISYNFSSSNLITFQFTTTNILYLYSGCQEVSGTSFAMVALTDTSVQWKVTFSSDSRAFALSQGNNYLKPIIKSSQNNNSQYTVSYITLGIDNSGLSSYDSGDYSNWFVFYGGVLISLLLNCGFYVDSSAGATNCSKVANPIYGKPISESSQLTVVKISN